MVADVGGVSALAHAAGVKIEPVQRFLEGTVGVPSALMGFLGVEFDATLGGYIQVKPIKETVALIDRGMAARVQRLLDENKSIRIMLKKATDRLEMVGRSSPEASEVRDAILAIGGIAPFAARAHAGISTIEHILSGKREPGVNVLAVARQINKQSQVA